MKKCCGVVLGSSRPEVELNGNYVMKKVCVRGSRSFVLLDELIIELEL